MIRAISTVLGAFNVALTYPRVRSDEVRPLRLLPGGLKQLLLDPRSEILVDPDQERVLGGEAVEQTLLGDARLLGDRFGRRRTLRWPG